MALYRVKMTDQDENLHVVYIRTRRNWKPKYELRNAFEEASFWLSAENGIDNVYLGEGAGVKRITDDGRDAVQI